MYPPPAGSSSFTTSAPRSARTSVAYGPGRSRERSRTRTPERGRLTAPPRPLSPLRGARKIRRAPLEVPHASRQYLLQLHREPHVPLDLQLPGHEGHLRVELAVDDVEEVGVGATDGALRRRGRPGGDGAARRRAVHRPLTAAWARDVELVDRADLRDDVRLRPEPLRHVLLEDVLHALRLAGHNPPRDVDCGINREGMSRALSCQRAAAH